VIELSLQLFAPVRKGSHVKWFTDNQASARIVEVGSMKLELHRVGRIIFEAGHSSKMGKMKKDANTRVAERRNG